MKQYLPAYILIFSLIFFAGCTGGGGGSGSGVPDTTSPITVNSLGDEDIQTAAIGDMTLRAALASAADSQPIIFDPSLNGRTIELDIIGDEHSILKGEVMGMREEESGPVSFLVGYLERDYGRSALYARKNVVIDASALPNGITIKWTGGDLDPARVLAVYGDLTMTNVSITGGRSVAEDILLTGARECPYPEFEDDSRQCATRARGGAVAVWGTAQISDCKLYNNHVSIPFGVPNRSRDGGAFGGGLYADIVEMENCIVSGNSVTASGVSGGGVFSVGGADSDKEISSIESSSITGNYIKGLFAYGAGVYSDGGGIGKRNTMKLTNSTIARNKVDLLFAANFGYWRGGGFYMSNGYLDMQSCTVVENEVTGKPRTDSLDRPNLAGGIAATIGNAHAVEEMIISNSIVAGNIVHEDGGDSYNHDIFTGSILHFRSMGYNRFGVVDFSQILVPVGERTWGTFARKHYPKAGDTGGIDVADVLDINNAVTNTDSILSVGVDDGQLAVLYYEPLGNAIDQVPTAPYQIDETYVDYTVNPSGTNNFLAIMLQRIEDKYSLDGNFDTNFTTDFETFLQSVDLDNETGGNQPYLDPDNNPILTLADSLWFGPREIWPKLLENHPYIHFWHQLDTALLDESIPSIGPELINYDAWATLFDSGALDENDDIVIFFDTDQETVFPQNKDQLGTSRPANAAGDIGAIEIP